MKRMKKSAVVQRIGYLIVLVSALAAAASAAIHQAPAAPPAARLTLLLDAAHSAVHWTLGSTLHTVHGTFAMKRGEVHVDPATGSAGGEFVADATSGKSDNDSRDKKMHKEILESAKYNDIVFRPTKIDGAIALQGASNVQVHGIFILHGSEHEITIPVQAELSGTQWKGSAKFSVPYVPWGLKSPNTFLLKADPAVEIDLELSGSLQSTSAN
jgi:polyisoprenoid-binding protein YceI